MSQEEIEINLTRLECDLEETLERLEFEENTELQNELKERVNSIERAIKVWNDRRSIK